MAFTTTTNVKEYLGITDAGLDTLIGKLITRMEGVIKRYTNRDIEAADFTEQYNAAKFNGGILNLNQFPVNSVASLFDDVDLNFGVETQIDADDFTFEPDTGVLRLLNNRPFTRRRPIDRDFDEGILSVKITYNGGFTTVPDDIEQATIDLVDMKLQQRNSGGGFIKSEKLADHSVTYNSAVKIPEAILATLDQYINRRMVVI